MACDLRCPNCLDNLGKDTENPITAWCDTCGHEFKNPRGYSRADDWPQLTQDSSQQQVDAALGDIDSDETKAKIDEFAVLGRKQADKRRFD